MVSAEVCGLLSAAGSLNLSAAAAYGWVGLPGRLRYRVLQYAESGGIIWPEMGDQVSLERWKLYPTSLLI